MNRGIGMLIHYIKYMNDDKHLGVKCLFAQQKLLMSKPKFFQPKTDHKINFAPHLECNLLRKDKIDKV